MNYKKKNKYNGVLLLADEYIDRNNRIRECLLKDKSILNKKTRIYKNNNNFIFLGRNKYNNYTKYRNIKRKIRYKKYLYEMNIINLNSYISSIISYKNKIIS